MRDPIEPALSAEEWAGRPHDLDYPEDGIAAPCAVRGDPADYMASGVSLYEGELQIIYDQFHVAGFNRPAAVLAVANAALPDSDPRKITREKIAAIRSAAGNSDGEGWPVPLAEQFADALESYLPPVP